MATKTLSPKITVKPVNQIAESLKFEVVASRDIQLTHKRAYEFLELSTFPGERNVIEAHVQSLYNAFCAGRFIWEHVIIATCKCMADGKTYRINGQHTCWMRINAPENISAEVRFIEYAVETEEQLRALYSTFDQNKTRTPGHVVRSLLTGMGATADIWPSSINKLAAGMRLWQFEKPSERQTLAASEIAAIIETKYPELFRMVGLFQQQHYSDGPHARRAAVIAGMFATFNIAGGKAPEFWDAVLTGLNLNEKSDPRFQLRHYLLKHGNSLSGGSDKEASSPEETYRVCILCWNKWRKGEKAMASPRPTDNRLKPV